ncbi:MAG TPA: FecR domain-containing protein [Chitinophagaceae bacterium]|nr:FecR domain-containing protein [Chitinophagaceae bacterium]
MWQLLSVENNTENLSPLLRQLWEEKASYEILQTRWNRQFNAFKLSQQFSKQHKIRRIYNRVAVAASIAILSVGSYFFISNHQSSNKKNTTSVIVLHDVKAPTTDKATLTLSNGKIIILDSVNTGSLAQEGAANANKINDSKLLFIGNPATAKVEYQTLQIPRGSKPIQLQLADGSQVWLNSASSITFPNIFIGNQRNVTITGEAYFEVAHNTAQPFIVKVNEMKVEVLGTHFNINSYSDEDEIKTTLLEGRIKINTSADTKILNPEQQAQLNKAGSLKVIHHVNINEVIAWKEGDFIFENSNIYEIMKQLQRWYDVDVEFNNQNIHQHFTGIISRNVSLMKVLKMLEKSSSIQFSINNKKVIIQ